MGVAEYTGNALEMEALVKFTTNGTRDMLNSIPNLRNGEKFRGSAGSAVGSGTRRTSS